MTKLYRYYQQTGGLDPWIAVHANADFYEIKPTFITVLALDTLIEDSPSREQLDAVKYQGPMYFDLDSSDIEQSIEGGKALLEKLLESGLKDHDVEIYLSGKKGLHFIIPQVCFMEKQHPQVRLPAIYKEMAFKLAVDTVDFRVYTARKGRMLRTCHNIRENGNYRVPITAEELRSLDGDTYDLLCKNPRAVPKTSPQFRAEFSLIFDAAQQKVLSVKRKKHKPASQQDLQKVSGDLKAILKGENLVDVGFNKIAMQLAIYAREAGWTEDVLVKQAEGLLNNHQSDGSRYNTPRRREEELRRMFSYVDDNPAYEYQASFLKALIVKQAAAPIFDEHGEVEVDNFVLSSGVYNSGGKYTVSRGEDGEQEIASFVFSNIQLVLDARDGRITAIRAKLPKGTVVTLTPNNFTSSTALQNVVSVYGESFTGSDIHARGIYQIMIREAGENSYIVDSEGMNLVKLPAHPDKEVSENAFVMWADRYLTVTPAWVREKGVKMEFVGYPEEAGVIQTDLSKAPTMKEFLSVDGNKERLVTCIKSICKASHAETVAKLLGWMVASHWRPFFQLTQGKYPLLHVFGPAGMGKCLGVDTPVIMFDGSIKKVQDVVVGDKLLGPDGSVRNVLSLARGREKLYKVTPTKGDSYIVNESHILSLKKSDKNSGKLRLSDGTYVAQDADIVNVNVKTIYDTEERYASKLKGWRADCLEFPIAKEKLLVDPYWLGVWLGDGKADDVTVYKPACNMTSWIKAYAGSLGLRVSVYDMDKCPGWAIVSNNGNNPIRNFLADFNLIRNKHIPKEYLTASAKDRLSLLAGLVDSDGYVTSGCVEIVAKSDRLAADILFLARSLGYAAYSKKCVKSIKSTGFTGVYNRITISGNCEAIPTLDKKAIKRTQVKRVTVTGITVEPLDIGDYYGFQIDGDHLFLLGDFTVTHNTEMTQTLLKLFYYKEEPKSTTPSSTTFAFMNLLAGSSSIPVLLDEWKPAVMHRDVAEKYRGIFRDAYNGKEVQRGGGNKNSGHYAALAKQQLHAPMVYISEACESETAILERSVILTFRRAGGRQQGASLAHFRQFQALSDCLPVLGKCLVTAMLQEDSLERFKHEFGTMLDRAFNYFMMQPEDVEKIARGELSEVDIKRKTQNTQPRPIYNSTVVLYGLTQMKRLLKTHLGELFDDELETLFKGLSSAAYAGLTVGVAMKPEYIKVLIAMSDMSRTADTAGSNIMKLVENVDYNLAEIGGRSVLVLATRFAYNKYRAYCRSIGSTALYPNEASFATGLMEIPQFIKMAEGTFRLKTDCVVLDVEKLQMDSVPVFAGKAIDISL